MIRPRLTDCHTIHTPAAVAITSAITDASSPKVPPDSHSEPDSCGRHQAVGIDPRHRHAEDEPLGEIPRRVEPDREPQAAGQHIGAAEQDSGLDRDREGRKPGRIGVEQMGEAEQRRGDRERQPAAAEFLDPAEEDAAEQQLLAKPGKQGHACKGDQEPVGPAIAGDPVDPGHIGNCGNRAEQQEADRQAGGGQRERALGRQIVDRLVAEVADGELIDHPEQADVDHRLGERLGARAHRRRFISEDRISDVAGDDEQDRRNHQRDRREFEHSHPQGLAFGNFGFAHSCPPIARLCRAARGLPQAPNRRAAQRKALDKCGGTHLSAATEPNSPR